MVSGTLSLICESTACLGMVMVISKTHIFNCLLNTVQHADIRIPGALKVFCLCFSNTLCFFLHERYCILRVSGFMELSHVRNLCYLEMPRLLIEECTCSVLFLFYPFILCVMGMRWWRKL
jgi:hypothetical protein